MKPGEQLIHAFTEPTNKGQKLWFMHQWVQNGRRYDFEIVWNVTPIWRVKAYVQQQIYTLSRYTCDYRMEEITE